MGLNDQAEADALEEGLEDNTEGREQDVVATEHDDQQGKDFQDVDDIESYQNAVGALEAADDLAEEGEGSGEPGRDQSGESEEGSEQSGDEGQEQSGDDEADSEDDGEDGEGEEDESEGQDDGDGEGQEESDDDDGKEAAASKRIRLRTSDNPVRARAIELMQRNQDMLPSEAEAKAKAELGIDDGAESSESGEESDEGEENGLPKTVEDARAQLSKLRAERSKAYREDLDFDKGEELDAQIDQLNDHIGDLKLSEVQNKQSVERQHLEQFEASKAKAVDLYPFVTSEDGKEIERMEEIDQQLKDSGDPLYSDPEKPLRIAQMVAKEFGIAPKGKVVKQPDAATRKGGKPPRQKSPVQPASGNARTAPKHTQGQLEERIAKIDNPLDYEEAIADFG